MIVVLLLPQAAAAQTPEQTAQAQALFDQGRTLMADRDVAAACEKFEASRRLDDALGTLLNLADCREQEGRLVTAWVLFLDGASRAKLAGDAKRESFARERATAVERRIPHVTITVPAERQVDGLVIELDGVALDRAQWDAWVPVDPGAHTIRGSAPGRGSWSVELTFAESDRQTFDAPALDTEAAPLPDAPPDQGPTTRPGRGFRIGFYASLGVTTVSAAVAVWGLAARSGDDDDIATAITSWQTGTSMQLDLDDPCGDAAVRLDGQNVDRRDLLEQVDGHCQAGSNRRLATNVALAVTAVGAVATGLLFYKGFVAAKRPARRGAVTWAPAIAPGHVGAALHLTF